MITIRVETKKAINLLFCLLLSLMPIALYGKNHIEDRASDVVGKLFSKSNTVYTIRYSHTFGEVVNIPEGCELVFKGGALSGPIVFHNTKLSGNVNLKGSRLRGTISNRFFDASWLCNADGVNDDAVCINDMIAVSNKIIFPRGTYRLIESYNPEGTVNEEYTSSIKAHIGINKDNVSLIGEDGCVFVTEKPLGSICIYSQPNNIAGSKKNIRIKGIKLKVLNNGVNFQEFMHTIKVIGVNGLAIENCYFDDFWGDAICLSHYGDSPSTGERTRNMNVRIVNNYIVGGKSHNNRNGISIISGQNVTIKNNMIKETSSPKMPGGIDIEPNNSAYTIDNIRIEKNYFDGIKGFVGAIGIVLLRDEAPAKKISIIGNRIENSTYGIAVGITTQSSTEQIVIKNNVVDTNTIPYKFEGGGKSKNWVVKGNIFERYCPNEIPGDIEVKNLSMSRNKKKLYNLDNTRKCLGSLYYHCCIGYNNKS